MYIDLLYIDYLFTKWLHADDGVAALEAVLLFPPMITLVAGVYDLGNGIILSERTITSSQIAADLVSRNKTIDSVRLADLIDGAKLAFEPYHLSGFGIDIVSIRFDDQQRPEILWRETQNMDPNDVAVASVNGFSEEGEGMIIVTVKYTYVPQFAQFFTGNIDFTEVAFSRGRRSATVTWEG